MSLKTCKTAYGDCTFYGKDEYIGRSLYAYGEWSGDECDKLISLACGHVLDVGANIGYMSMALASKCPVTAFEPQPELFKLLEQNVESKPVQCWNLAIGSSCYNTIMPKIRYGERGNYGGLPIGVRSELGSIEVKVVSLDSFNYSGIGLIKIDVEGYEEEVLRGATDLISRCSPILYLEDDRLEKRASLRAFIKSLGYQFTEHKTKLFRKNNFAGNTKDIWDSPYESHNLICWK